MRAIQMTEFGGPEVLKLAELPVPVPGPGEVLIKVTRAGLNFADTHTRTNSYVQKATLPLVPGGEVGGRRARTPASASSRSPAPAATPSTRCAPADHVFPIPEDLDDGTALAMIIQGTTAWHLYRTAGARRATARASSSTAPPAASARSPCSWRGRSAPAA